MTINEITIQMRRLADMAGGDHLTGKEIEKQLNYLANELDEDIFIVADMFDLTKNFTFNAYGLTEETLRLWRKHNKEKRHLELENGGKYE